MQLVRTFTIQRFIKISTSQHWHLSPAAQSCQLALSWPTPSMWSTCKPVFGHSLPAGLLGELLDYSLWPRCSYNYDTIFSSSSCSLMVLYFRLRKAKLAKHAHEVLYTCMVVQGVRGNVKVLTLSKSSESVPEVMLHWKRRLEGDSRDWIKTFDHTVPAPP